MQPSILYNHTVSSTVCDYFCQNWLRLARDITDLFALNLPKQAGYMRTQLKFIVSIDAIHSVIICTQLQTLFEAGNLG